MLEIPLGLVLTPSMKRMEESIRILGKGKKEYRYFGMAVQFDVRDYLLSKGENLTLFEDIYPADWAYNFTLYDVKCSEESGNTHTVTGRERKLWDKHLINGHEVLIWSCKRLGNTATLIKEIPYRSVKLLPSKYDNGWYFFLN